MKPALRTTIIALSGWWILQIAARFIGAAEKLDANYNFIGDETDGDIGTPAVLAQTATAVQGVVYLDPPIPVVAACMRRIVGDV